MATAEELASYLSNPNVQMVLRTIGQAEGTIGDKIANPYRVGFGGSTIESLDAHPNVLVPFTQTDGKQNQTSAAGAYQFLKPTWDDVSSKLGLKDFGPRSQDIAALELIRRAGALDDVLNGNSDAAIGKLGGTWASLPSSPYAQPKRSPGFIEQALNAVIPAAEAAGAPKIDPSQVQWDEPAKKAASSPIDVAKVQWDEPPDASAAKPYTVEMSQESAQRMQDGKNHTGVLGLIEDLGADVRKAVQGSPDSSITGFGAGLGAGTGTVALNAQRYLGKGINSVSDFFSPPERGVSSLVTGKEVAGGNAVGNWLVQDAEKGLKNLQSELAPYKEASPIAAGSGELAGNLAATWPVGGYLAKAARTVAPALGGFGGVVNRLADSLATGGVRIGATPQSGVVGNTLLRAAGGGGTGLVSAGLVNPDDAKMGGIVGAAFPVIGRAVGATTQAAGRALRGGDISQPVRDLAARAAELGIDIPADRIANSRPLNAVASSLNYVPFSGRAAVEDRMQQQLNRAVTRTFGQDSTNVTQALRQAADDLGQKFDDVLQKTAVKADSTLIDDLSRTVANARDELTDQQFGVISRQVDNILGKVKSGDVIDADAAYNIKKGLDRIGKSNDTSLAYYAGDLRRNLMDALNRSLGPDEAKAFAKTREQYGNMLSLERLAKNGAEGDISIARLANMQGIRSRELQELADISSQFLKAREGQHGAMQRAFVGAGIAGTGGVGSLAGGAAIGRGVNQLLNSSLARESVMGNGTAIDRSLNRLLPLIYRSAPVITAQ